MKIKHHPGIIEDLYPKLALVIIKLNSTIISTGKNFISGCKFILLTWNSRFPFCSYFLSGYTVPLQFFFSWTLIAWWPAALSCLSSNTQGGVYQARWSPWLKNNRRGYDSFSGLPLCCIIFIKVTLTVSTTQINYFILPLTSPKFFLHFNRGDLVGEGRSMEPLSGAWTPEGPLFGVTH